VFVQTFIQKQIADIKRDFTTTYVSWKKLNASEFGILLKITLIFLLLSLTLGFFVGTRLESTAYYGFIALAVLLGFVWLGFLAAQFYKKTLFVGKYTSKFFHNWPTELVYLRYRLNRYLIIAEYFISATLNWAPDRKVKESYATWLKRLKPNQAIPSIRFILRLAQNELQYLTWVKDHYDFGSKNRKLEKDVAASERDVKKYRAQLVKLERRSQPFAKIF